MKEKILILDFGSQYTQLIARRVRECGVYSEIVPYNKVPVLDESIKGIILSGSPASVREANAPQIEADIFTAAKPVLGVCYGAQYLAQYYGGQVARSEKREYGQAVLTQVFASDVLFDGVPNNTQVWMSHGDTITELPEDFELLYGTNDVAAAAYRAKAGRFAHPVYGLQFHPEVTHSLEGKRVIENFLFKICGCAGAWSPAHFVAETVAQLLAQLGQDKVLMALSGGVDSSVAALLLHKAIGNRLHCFFVDNGLLRKNEFEEVLASYAHLGLQIVGVDAKNEFYSALAGLTDPEAKRKAIGRVFIEVFEQQAAVFSEMKWLGQGTIYPDVIESVSVHGPSVTIKSHHNVGGLPARMGLKVVEPLRLLFKDEVRKVGAELNLPPLILQRHPFPGPGLGIRILGEVTPERVALLQAADAIYTQHLRDSGWYNKVWQAGAILLPVYSVGVMGDERTYEQVCALRAVNSTDGMTADWSQLPYDLLAKISSDIINQVRGINRVVYDISTKPPATIEWE